MRIFVLTLCLIISAMPSAAYEAIDALRGTSAPRASDRLRCTNDAAHCISAATFVTDVCTTIQRAAQQNDLDPHFIARLLWKESLFEPDAVSPVGAMGIAQFMPGTAQMVGLDDPFNPAKAIIASAAYLKKLSDGFGNLGLAAVAYNGGENRAARFIAKSGGLPWETQDYVQAITGHAAAIWRDKPPARLDIRLDGDRAFLPACIDLASSRKLREFKTQRHAWPWGVIVATNPSQDGIRGQVARLNRSMSPILGGKRVEYVRRRMTGNRRQVYTAQIGYSSKSEAWAFCTRLRGVGGRCIVLRN